MDWKQGNRISVVAVCLGVVAVACGRQAEQRSVDLTVPVTVEPVSLGRVEATVSATGSLRALRTAQLVSEVRGTFRLSTDADGQLLGEGSSVSSGQVVARLENDELIVNARKESRQLAHDLAKRTLEEKRVLVRRGLVTQKEVDDARRAFEDARSTLQDAVIQIQKTIIRTPIDGVITGLTDVTVGTLMNPNTVVATVMDYSLVVVDLKIPNAHVATVSVGQDARVRNYAFADRTFKGRITAVDPALDPATRTFAVQATVENPDLALRPGMFVEADVVTDYRDDVIVIQRRFITRRRNQEVVFIEEEGRAQMIEITTGLEDETRVEIVSGLEQGDRLITSNFETLRGRTRVRVTGEGTLGGRTN